MNIISFLFGLAGVWIGSGILAVLLIRLAQHNANINMAKAGKKLFGRTDYTWGEAIDHAKYGVIVLLAALYIIFLDRDEERAYFLPPSVYDWWVKTRDKKVFAGKKAKK
ncbi:hypothetical protein [Methylobacillus sp.]|uniref:hypothetical protein n=1 Tax=Methylobacillus sp. TaxID=56818 RepID=UPI0012C1B984|nr:hypothetical protein [Methylobacillus sp.]MPS48495.1 hypothetical protein [Methylobacillus sp.]